MTDPYDPIDLEPDEQTADVDADALFGGPPPPPPIPTASAVPPPLPAAAVSPSAPPPTTDPPKRDRILILGRRRAGKTVFLARLYERLWNSKGDIHMAAVDGRTHVEMLKQIDAMMKRRWPSATENVRDYTFDVTYKNERVTMTAPDYPGEVFGRAFMGGDQNEPAVRDLLAAIDRAAAIIVLVDPHVASQGDLLEMSEQDFGLVAAIKRVRDSPGAEHVPVAVTLTKCDRFREEIQAAGGPGKYIRDTYMNLCRVVFRKGRAGTVFACSAIGTKRDGVGNEVPDLSKPPRGLIEPLEYCLEALQRNRRQFAQQEDAERERTRRAELLAVAERSERRATVASNVVMILSVLFGALVVIAFLLIAFMGKGK